MFNSLLSCEVGYYNTSLIRRINSDFANNINKEDVSDINKQNIRDISKENAGDINSDYNSLSDNIVNKVLKPY
jgi:hypothetical protein